MIGSVIPSPRDVMAGLFLLGLGAAGGQAQTDTVIRQAGPPRHAGGGTLVEELSIGVVDGAAEYMFGEVFDVMPGRNGALYVLDRMAMELRVYDAAGKYVRTIARRGRGPGEITGPSGMAVLADGRLLLYDIGNKRVNVYAPAGAPLPPWMITGVNSSQPRSLVADTAGFAYLQKTVIRRYPSKNMNGRPIMDGTSRWLRIRAADGAVVDSIDEPKGAPPVEPFFSAGTSGWRQMAVPFMPRPLAVVSPLGILVTGYATQYSFELVPRTQPIVSVRRDVPAAQIPAKERSNARSVIETRMRDANPLWTWAGRDIPTHRPLYSDLSVGLDGRIWIMREEPTRPPRARKSSGGQRGGSMQTAAEIYGDGSEHAGVYDVFEPNGAFIGQVTMPLRVFPLVMRGDQVWGIARDDDDVQFVKRFRVVWK